MPICSVMVKSGLTTIHSDATGLSTVRSSSRTPVVKASRIFMRTKFREEERIQSAINQKLMIRQRDEERSVIRCLLKCGSAALTLINDSLKREDNLIGATSRTE